MANKPKKKTYFARFRGKCRICGFSFEKGDIIQRIDIGPIHTSCFYKIIKRDSNLVKVKTGCLCGSYKGILQETDCKRCKSDFDKYERE